MVEFLIIEIRRINPDVLIGYLQALGCLLVQIMRLCFIQCRPRDKAFYEDLGKLS